MQDGALLRRYVEQNSQEAFAALTARHVSLVYSTCLREVGDPQMAEDVTQTVFLVLARKAPSLRAGAALPGWLFQTARFASRNALTRERRRRRAEERAAQTMPSPTTREDAPWDSIAPVLNDALARLGATERDAVLLRCLEGHNLAETGAALGLSEEAARKRVARALEKVRRFFAAEGVVVSGAALAVLLPAHAVRAAPGGCAPAIAQMTAGVLAGQVNTGLIGAGIHQLAEGVLRAMKIAQMKAVAAGVAAALAGLTTYAVARGALTPGMPAARVAPLAAQRPDVPRTPDQIIQRSEQAYAALQSYQGTATVDGRFSEGGATTETHTSADIAFARPAKIRVAGTAMNGKPYVYVSNGTDTFDMFAGPWQREGSIEGAIGGATGISAFAGTTIPALLLHTNWGYPFSPPAKSPGPTFGPVTQERVGGILCYRFTDTQNEETQTMQYDAKTRTMAPIGAPYPQRTSQTY